MLSTSTHTQPPSLTYLFHVSVKKNKKKLLSDIMCRSNYAPNRTFRRGRIIPSVQYAQINALL